MHDPVTHTIPSAGGTAPGSLEIDYVDGVGGLVPHSAPPQVPRGAPVDVRGWASQPGARAPRAIRVLLDRAHVYEVDASGDGGPGVVRYRVTIPTTAITPGGHEVRAVVLADDERWYEAGLRAFTVYEPLLTPPQASPRSARLRVERIVDARPDTTRRVASGAVRLGHFAIVSGWAVDAQTLAPAGGVVVTAAGRRYSAPCNIARPDVRGALGGDADAIGFDVVIPTSDLGLGDHVARVDSLDAQRRVSASCDVVIHVASRERLFPAFASRAPHVPAHAVLVRVRAAADDDRSAGADDDAESEAAPPPAGERTWHATRADTLEIGGWTDDPWGAPATEVFVELIRADDVATIAPHRIAALAGYRDADAPRGGSFSLRLPLRHERAARFEHAQFEVALLALGPDRRVYGRIPLGTLLLAPVSAP